MPKKPGDLRKIRESKNSKLQKIKKTIKEALNSLKVNEQMRQDYGGEIKCFCGDNNSPKFCTGVMIQNYMNCTCCGRGDCMNVTQPSKGFV